MIGDEELDERTKGERVTGDKEDGMKGKRDDMVGISLIIFSFCFMSCEIVKSAVPPFRTIDQVCSPITTEA